MLVTPPIFTVPLPVIDVPEFKFITDVFENVVPEATFIVPLLLNVPAELSMVPLFTLMVPLLLISTVMVVVVVDTPILLNVPVLVNTFTPLILLSAPDEWTNVPLLISVPLLKSMFPVERLNVPLLVNVLLRIFAVAEVKFNIPPTLIVNGEPIVAAVTFMVPFTENKLVPAVLPTVLRIINDDGELTAAFTFNMPSS
jgi:hypothetical protein